MVQTRLEQLRSAVRWNPEPRIARDNNSMHAKPDLRVVLEWKIYRPDSVIAADYEVPGLGSVVFDFFASIDFFL